MRMKEFFTISDKELDQSSAVVVGPQKYKDVPDGMSEGQGTIQSKEDDTTEEEESTDRYIV